MMLNSGRIGSDDLKCGKVRYLEKQKDPAIDRVFLPTKPEIL